VHQLSLKIEESVLHLAARTPARITIEPAAIAGVISASSSELLDRLDLAMIWNHHVRHTAGWNRIGWSLRAGRL
jgi:hypothetical protein